MYIWCTSWYLLYMYPFPKQYPDIKSNHKSYNQCRCRAIRVHVLSAKGTYKYGTGAGNTEQYLLTYW